MKSWFLKRGYPNKLIEEQTSKVIYGQTQNSRNHKNAQGIPLVLTYNPSI